MMTMPLHATSTASLKTHTGQGTKGLHGHLSHHGPPGTDGLDNGDDYDDQHYPLHFRTLHQLEQQRLDVGLNNGPKFYLLRSLQDGGGGGGGGVALPPLPPFHQRCLGGVQEVQDDLCRGAAIQPQLQLQVQHQPWPHLFRSDVVQFRPAGTSPSTGLDNGCFLLKGRRGNAAGWSSGPAYPPQPPPPPLGPPPAPPTEVDVIRDWFVNIFQPLEKTSDIEVTDFKFEQMNGGGKGLLRTNGGGGDAASAATRAGNGPGNNLAKDHLLGGGGDPAGLQRDSSSFGGGGGGSSAEDDGGSGSGSGGGSPFIVIKKADVELLVGGKPKMYSVIIKVLPTDDSERHTSRSKFLRLLKFSKEVQVYAGIIRCMTIYDEKRYPSACVEPPVPKCYLSQLDAQNDVLVLENLEQSGFRRYRGSGWTRSGSGSGSGGGGPEAAYISDIDHCRVVLRRLAHFHVISMLIQRDSETDLLDLFPFAVDGSVFQEDFHSRTALVRRELAKFLRGEEPFRRKDRGNRCCRRLRRRPTSRSGGGGGSSLSSSSALKENGCSSSGPDKDVDDEDKDEDGDEGEGEELVEATVDRHLQELFWRLVELRAQPKDDQVRLCVLAHGCLDLRHVLFQYDEVSERPIAAKFLDFSSVTVASPVLDITYFFHSSVEPELASRHHSLLLQIYHRSHLEAIESFGMHGYEIELEDLVNEYQAKQDYGAMMACLLKPALYVLQCIDLEDHKGPAEVDEEACCDNRNNRTSGGDRNGHHHLQQEKRSGGCNAAVSGRPTSPPEVVGTNTATAGAAEKQGKAAVDDVSLDHKCSLRINKSMVPANVRIFGHLATLARECPCPCSVVSRELTMTELSSDSLEDLHVQARKELAASGLKAFDCNGGGPKKTLKQLFKGLNMNGGAAGAGKDHHDSNKK